MKLFSAIVLLSATADARRRKKNQRADSEGSGEGSGVAPVTAEDAVVAVDDLVGDIVDAASAAGESTKALVRRIDALKSSKSNFSSARF